MASASPATTRASRKSSEAIPMPEKTIKRRLQDCDAGLASDDGPIFSTVAKLVDALKRSIPEGTQNAELKNVALFVQQLRLEEDR